ncbi:hypothetical protein G7046_g2606 [Stylonectria norvegica]|nr:hypothetical protein G7046_g2606 [Stylonectria norvegica]
MSASNSVISQFEAANAKFVSSFDQGHLPLPPSRYVSDLHWPAVFTDCKPCMDARLDPAKVLGIGLGEAHVIRNAGGRTVDALRSIVISQQLLGTREIVIVHHTDCGMLTFSDDSLRSKVRDELNEDVDHIAFLPFGDVKKSVVDDIAFVKKNPLILDVPVTGYVYDVKTGKIEKVD